LIKTNTLFYFLKASMNQNLLKMADGAMTVGRMPVCQTTKFQMS
jgi:hypothetical protein